MLAVGWVMGYMVRRMGDALGDSAQYWRASEAMTGRRGIFFRAASGWCDCTPQNKRAPLFSNSQFQDPPCGSRFLAASR